MIRDEYSWHDEMKIATRVTQTVTQVTMRNIPSCRSGSETYYKLTIAAANGSCSCSSSEIFLLVSDTLSLHIERAVKTKKTWSLNKLSNQTYTYYIRNGLHIGWLYIAQNNKLIEILILLNYNWKHTKIMTTYLIKHCK